MQLVPHDLENTVHIQVQSQSTDLSCIPIVKLFFKILTTSMLVNIALNLYFTALSDTCSSNPTFFTVPWIGNFGSKI